MFSDGFPGGRSVSKAVLSNLIIYTNSVFVQERAPLPELLVSFNSHSAACAVFKKKNWERERMESGILCMFTSALCLITWGKLVVPL